MAEEVPTWLNVYQGLDHRWYARGPLGILLGVGLTKDEAIREAKQPIVVGDEDEEKA